MLLRGLSHGLRAAEGNTSKPKRLGKIAPPKRPNAFTLSLQQILDIPNGEIGAPDVLDDVFSEFGFAFL